MRFALQWASAHLLVSMLVALAAAILVFKVWYPSPWRELLQVTGIFGIVVAVDLVCGPLLTFVLASPQKSRKERWVDLTLVAAIQLGALVYGISAVFIARPVMLVFEKDRFALVSANEVQTDQLGSAPEGMQALPLTGVRFAGLREARSGTEYLASVDESLQGITQAMRPSWWVPYESVRSDVIQRAKPLSDLIHRHPEDAEALNQAAAETGIAASSLFYLPLTTSKRMDWIALIDGAGSVVGYTAADGF